MSDDPRTGPLDQATLTVFAQRARSHPLVDECSFEPDALTPRYLACTIDDTQYPGEVQAVRLDIRWFAGGDYSFHYVEHRGNARWHCRWDRHPKPETPRSHFHPPPDAASTPEPSPIEAEHHLAVLFAVLDFIGQRVETLHETG